MFQLVPAVRAIRCTCNGEEALDRLDEAVDVVLLDRRMPGLSGDQVLDEIRLREYNCQVVMVTAIKPDFDITEMDFDHYLVKPTTKDDLHAIVEKMLTRATYEDRTQELFALASKHATLKTHKSDRELQSSDEFRELEDRLITVKKQLHETAIEFEPDDFEAMW